MIIAAVMLASTIGQAEAADVKKDPVVCRREAPVGSRVPGRRTCKKTSEWVEKSNKVDADGRVVPQWQGNGYSPQAPTT